MLVDTTAGREFILDFLWLSSALDMLRANARNFSIYERFYMRVKTLVKTLVRLVLGPV